MPYDLGSGTGRQDPSCPLSHDPPTPWRRAHGQARRPPLTRARQPTLVGSCLRPGHHPAARDRRGVPTARRPAPRLDGSTARRLDGSTARRLDGTGSSATDPTRRP
ncbi:hypothetical protein E1294_20860 [Nonomuraea diastatica]|uniref:Uncharacterized protein n=1 Tax=Nonomuraea diastatica TaxID=1848329 RepID=A0A4R4WNP1_9ACTN|nr:hypothetical protein E1294_20860 [Nonomuraea diastatica]